MKLKSVFNHTRVMILGSSFLVPMVIAISLCGCGGGTKSANGLNKQTCLDSIKSIEAKLKTMQMPDAATYNRAINAYMLFATNFPDDSAAPASLFNAANITMSINQYKRAINMYDTITIKYPAFRRVIDCYFNSGYIYDDKLKDTAKARAMYQMVIDKYPHDTVLTPQAKAAIAILGKSYDEVIKEFEEKNKNKK